MGVLLGLGHVQLRFTGAGDRRSERVDRAGRVKRHRIGPAVLILGHRREPAYGSAITAPAPPRKVLAILAEARLGQSAHDLTHPVRSEVEAQHAVLRTDPALRADGGGGDELVGLPARVRIMGGLRAARGGVLAAAVHQQVVGGLDTFPATVAVHRPVPPDDGGDATDPGIAQPVVERVQIPRSRGGRAVAPVGEAMHDQVRHADPCGELDQGVQVREAGVNAAVGHQPEQVYAL